MKKRSVPEPFFITPIIQGKQTRLRVYHLRKTLSLEYYEVSGRDRKIVLTNNRPTLQRMDIANVPLHWEVIEGEIKNLETLEAITKAIEAH